MSWWDVLYLTAAVQGAVCQVRAAVKTCSKNVHAWVCFQLEGRWEMELLTKARSLLITLKFCARLEQHFPFLCNTWSVGYETSFHLPFLHFHILSLAELTVLFVTEGKNCPCLKKRQYRWSNVFCNSWSVTPGLMMLILGSRHSWYFGSPPGGQEHHWDAGYHCPGTSACCCALRDGCVWAVWA